PQLSWDPKRDFSSAKIDTEAPQPQHVQANDAAHARSRLAQITQIIQHYRQVRYTYRAKLKIRNFHHFLCQHTIEIDNAYRPARNLLSIGKVRPQDTMRRPRIQRELHTTFSSNPHLNHDQKAVLDCEGHLAVALLSLRE